MSISPDTAHDTLQESNALGERPMKHPAFVPKKGKMPEWVRKMLDASDDKTAQGGRRGYRPGAGPAAQAYEERTGIKAPKIVAWEITRSCNLACAHCRAAAHCKPYPDELTLEECRKVIDDIAAITDPILILTGGEPLMRADIWDIIDYARERGLHPVIGTNGTLIDDECARKIAEHGIPRVSVSLDFPTAEGQDSFRGQEGAFESTMEGVNNLRSHGVEVQVNTTITKMNNHLVDDLHQMALDAGAVAFHPFLLVPTGRGEDLVDVELSPQEYEEVLTWAYHKQKCSPMHFKPTDSPQYYRIMRQQAAAEGVKVTPETHGMEAMTRGCLGGISFVFISHVGDVQPCGYFDMQLGNVKKRTFEDIWTNSPIFDDLRHYDRLRGKCGDCEFKGVCGGCRARALAATGDYLAEEPYCAYIPRKYAREKVLDLIQSGFPIEHDPLAGIARETGLNRDTAREALDKLRDTGIVRRIGASYAAKGVGYVSTLCAMKVPEERMDEVAAIAGSYPGVTHNYARENRYNLWFTLIVPSRERAQRILDEIADATDIPVLNMPSVKTYKIRVDFSADHQLREALKGVHVDPSKGHGAHPPICGQEEQACLSSNPSKAIHANDSASMSASLHHAPVDSPACEHEQHTTSFSHTSPQDAAAPLAKASKFRDSTDNPASPAHESVRAFDSSDSFDVELVRWSQQDVFADNEGFPFEEGARVLSERLGKPVSEQQVLDRIQELLATGAIRRFGAIVRHQKMGYSTNAMTAWTIPHDQLDTAGAVLASSPNVSHCYSRTPQADWTANLYGMVHAQSDEEMSLIVKHLHIFLKRAGIECNPPLVLTSTKEYKKTSMRYFEE